MAYKKGDTVVLRDGATTKTALVVKDGVDANGKVRVRPTGFPMDLSVGTDNKDPLYIITTT